MSAGALPESGRVALVSGADVGVGAQLVRRLSALGMRVVAGCRSVERGRRVVDGFGDLADRVAVRRLEVTDAGDVAQLTAWVAARLGRCDVLLCHLTARYADPAAVPRAAVRDELTANLRGIRRLAHGVAPLMRTAGYGRVVTVSTGDFGSPGFTAAGSGLTRSGVDALTTVLSEDLGSGGILVNSICPGPDAGGSGVPSSPVDTAVWLATLPGDGPTGLLCG
ncbi:SDR family NAD(P)-dependent oxidoreductase [Actinoplanes sp. NPDC049316]|uniref:SDR family NAD(P)-dependent oxidoreductase n=1 Tax=Actinoplanes sp. NPDC049316 TaxID=3154727 RepID=UPI0034355BFC